MKRLVLFITILFFVFSTAVIAADKAASVGSAVEINAEGKKEKNASDVGGNTETKHLITDDVQNDKGLNVDKNTEKNHWITDDVKMKILNSGK
jgi:hypothetical protein